MDRKALESMLDRGMDNSLLRYTLGTLCLQQDDPESAVTHLQRALEQDDQHSASWKHFGKALAALHRTDEARDAWQRGIAVAEDKGDVQAVKEMRVFLKRLDKSQT
ncbi:MAG: tetratricopeptide repeat protein [Candidatus Thiodiazotropha sp.]